MVRGLETEPVLIRVVGVRFLRLGCGVGEFGGLVLVNVVLVG